MISGPKLKVHILSAYAESNENFAAKVLREEIRIHADRLPISHVECPETADCILFMEHHPPSDPLFLKVYRSNVFRKHSRKCLLYHDSDFAFPVIGGIYPSATRRACSWPWVVSSPYFFQTHPNAYVPDNAAHADVSHLYSFVGNMNTYPSRKSFKNLSSDGRSLIVDTSEKGYMWTAPIEMQQPYHMAYAESLTTALFILCPRGVSPCSYRLTEAMCTGRAPVIISDEWFFPDWLPWNEFALVVEQKNIAAIPEMLRARERDGLLLGRRAREVWEKWLAPGFARAHTVANLVCRLFASDRPMLSSRRALSRTLLTALPTQIGRTLLRQSVKAAVAQQAWGRL